MRPSHDTALNQTRTPQSYRISGTEQITLEEQDRNWRYKALAWEAQGHFVGPVDPAWFLERYLNTQEILDGQPFPDILPKWTGFEENMPEAEMNQHIVSNRIFYFSGSF